MRRPPEDDEDDADRRQKGGAADATLGPWFALYEERLRQLAEAAASGAADTDLILADIIDSAPQDMRDSLVGRFRSLVKEQKKEKSAPAPTLTPQQEQMLALLQEQEQQMMIAQFLSKKTLDKIRRAFLMNPQLMEEVITIGEQLARRGLMVESGKLRMKELGDLEADRQRSEAAKRRKDERER